MQLARGVFVGGFAIAAVAFTSPSALAQIVAADVGKNLEYQQTGPSTVVPFNGGTNAFIFGRVFFPPGSFDGGQMTFTGPSSPQNFNISGLIDCCGNNGMGYQSGYMTPAALNAGFPSATTYTLTATNSVTLASEAVNVFYDDVFTSDIPQLAAASFTALQNANPHVGMTINFNSFTPNPSATQGQGFFTIYDYTTSTTVVNDAGFSPTTTSISFGAGTLTAGNSYVFELIFDDILVGNDPTSGLNTDGRSDVRTLGYFTAASTAAPEPSTWALMLAGFAGLSLVVHGRRRAAA